LKAALTTSDTNVIKKCLREAMNFKSIETLVKEGQQFLNRKRIEEYTLRSNMEKALKANDFNKLIDLIPQAERYPSLEPIVLRARNKLAGGKVPEYRFEEDIEKLVLENNAEGLSQYIAQNENIMPSKLLKVAKAKLNKLRGNSLTVEDSKQAMINSVYMKDKEKLKAAINDAQLLAKIVDQNQSKIIQTLLERGKEILKRLENGQDILLDIQEYFSKLDTNDDLERDMIDNDPSTFAEMLRRGLLYKDNAIESKKEANEPELLQRLQLHVTKLRSACNQSNAFDHLGRYIIKMSNRFGQNVVSILADIIAHKSKKRLFSSGKSCYEILKGIRRPETISLVDKFESFDLVKDLLEEKQYGYLSLLYVHFLLSEQQLNNVLSYLLSDEIYMNECYDSTAFLRNASYREDMNPYLAILKMFNFQLSIGIQSHTVIISPLVGLKSAVKNIVQYFVTHKNHLEICNNLGINEPANYSQSFDTLIKSELCNALLSVVYHRFKESTYFSEYSIWQLIEEVAQLRQVSALDIGGLLLPSAVQYINENVSANRLNKKNESEIKFKALICHCLNEGSLVDVFETIFKDYQVLCKYYEVDIDKSNPRKPLVTDPLAFGKVCSYLRSLSKLPFHLSIQ
jgi:hypothetical protein